jgi:Cys-tRNA(Pro)/Cys-tRNA(Cys) deacylase
MRQLSGAGINFTVKEYPFDESDLSAPVDWDSLGLPSEQVFKTLVMQGASGNYAVCCVPSPMELDLKKTAKAVGEKSITLVPVKAIQPLTGYIRRGCSPIGMKKQYPTFIDETAQLFDVIAVNAGERGILIILNPVDLCNFINAKFADLV